MGPGIIHRQESLEGLGTSQCNRQYWPTYGALVQHSPSCWLPAELESATPCCVPFGPHLGLQNSTGTLPPSSSFSHSSPEGLRDGPRACLGLQPWLMLRSPCPHLWSRGCHRADTDEYPMRQFSFWDRQLYASLPLGALAMGGSRGGGKGGFQEQT